MEDADDDIAVIGIGCNFPGGEGLDNFWRVLLEGKNCVVDIPPERFDTTLWYDADESKPGKTQTTKAALIEGFNEFDHRFFGITEAEADFMDPQQKLLLQCAYRALEDAGIAMESISGSRTGVYIGLMNRDYEILQSNSPTTINHYNGTGTAMSVAANRISFIFNLHGPSFAIDSACSSSLVGLHVACQAIKQGDCEMALCGGVSCILEPRVFIALGKAKMISPDGTSKPFSSRADGYGRGEGCGVVLLKPLKKAIKDCNRVWGIISKTAVNQDGHSVTPITKPSMTQQEELLRRIYSKSDLANVQYIEAHGTGTPVGDPIEAGSISNVIAKAQPPGSETLRIGSVKGNIGHTESAAGVAGLIKVGIAALLKHWGIKPDAVLGHSVGEVAAAHCSGLLTLEDAVKVLYHRSTLQNKVTGGKMLVVSNVAVEKVLKILPEFAGKICVAALNSPQSCTLSGDADAIAILQEKLKIVFAEEHLFLHELDVPAAYHSHMMDPILDDIEKSINPLYAKNKECQLFSTVTGNCYSDGDFTTGNYWAKNIREPVLLEQALHAVTKDKHSKTNVVFVEIGPRRALQRNIRETLGNNTLVLPSVQPEKDCNTILSTVAKLFELGNSVDWHQLYRGCETSPTEFPVYHFDNTKKELNFEAVIKGAFYVELAYASVMASLRPKKPISLLQLSVRFENLFALSSNCHQLKVTLEPVTATAKIIIPGAVCYSTNKHPMLKETPCVSYFILAWEILQRMLSKVEQQYRRLIIISSNSASALMKVLALSANRETFQLSRTNKRHTDADDESYFTTKMVQQVVLNQTVSDRPVSDIPFLPRSGKLFKQSSVYIVTGGLSGLGLETVKFIAHNVGGCIATLSRSALTDEMKFEIELLQKRYGVTIMNLQCDVSVSMQVLHAISMIKQKFPSCPIKGVFHSAAVLHDALIENLDESLFRKVLQPKVCGALNLHYATLHNKLDFFVCYSSISSFIGNASQCNYAAANSFLDSFCHYRRNLGLAGQSINWGPLNLGLLLNKDNFQQFLESKGMMVMDVCDVQQALETCLVMNRPQQVICKFNFKNLHIHVLSQNASLRERLSGLVEMELKDYLNNEPRVQHLSSPHESVRRIVSDIINVSVDELDDDSTLCGLGIDSMLAMTLQNKMFQETGVNVPLVKILDPNSTVATLACIVTNG
ncbi:hypothetical protein PBY51_014227 [Eleginops maclovinus]|uniref:Carrier domain-containing protein n=1 Tax=Eleginops maclovinus TaxID=56733 RepID=A0AAN7WWI7_ELEMC|nr:hypothetical protein PBY51_014227 [Eleginops maclovinus]